VKATQAVSRPLLWLAAGLLALSVLPHGWNLRPPVTLAFFLFAALRLLLWPRPETIPGLWIRAPLVVAGLGLVAWQAGLTESRQFGVALLVIMAGLKLLELHRQRDLFMVTFLGLFLLVTLFLFSDSALLTGYVLLLSIAWTAFLVLANRADADLPWREALGTALKLALGGLPVMALLFFLFPRLEGPLWSLQLGATAVTGMSDQVRMGSIARLGLSEEVAFRVRFEGEPPPADQRYWRGMVLWHTDGRTWRRVEAPPAHWARQAPEEALRYEVTMEPSGRPWLFPLDRVIHADATLRVDGDFGLEAGGPVRQRFTYRAASIRPPLREPLDGRQRQLGLQLPPRVSSRTRALARRWRHRAASDAEVVRLALDHFNREPFVYTLRPPLLEGDPVDRFLFVTRKGFCEHYATSFVLLMRLAGIPARVVVGYQGGELNPVGGHLVVRQSDAHAWAEVWLEGEGWTRVDPTAAVAPERIERGIAPVAAPVGAPARFRLSVDPDALTRLARRLGWYRDNLQLLWHYWVVGYDRDRQQSLLARMGLDGLSGYRLGLAAVLGALGAGALLFFLAGRAPRRPPDPARAAWKRFRRKLARAGLELPDTLGPLETAQAATARFPARAAELQRIAQLYIRLRYGPGGGRALTGELRRRIRRLRL